MKARQEKQMDEMKNKMEKEMEQSLNQLRVNNDLHQMKVTEERVRNYLSWIIKTQEHFIKCSTSLVLLKSNYCSRFSSIRH